MCTWIIHTILTYLKMLMAVRSFYLSSTTVSQNASSVRNAQGKPLSYGRLSPRETLLSLSLVNSQCPHLPSSGTGWAGERTFWIESRAAIPLLTKHKILLPDLLGLLGCPDLPRRGSRLHNLIPCVASDDKRPAGRRSHTRHAHADVPVVLTSTGSSGSTK